MPGSNICVALSVRVAASQATASGTPSSSTSAGRSTGSNSVKSKQGSSWMGNDRSVANIAPTSSCADSSTASSGLCPQKAGTSSASSMNGAVPSKKVWLTGPQCAPTSEVSTGPLSLAGSKLPGGLAPASAYTSRSASQY